MAEGHQCRPDSVAICNMKNDVTWAGQKDNTACPAVGVCMTPSGAKQPRGIPTIRCQTQRQAGVYIPLCMTHVEQEKMAANH